MSHVFSQHPEPGPELDEVDPSFVFDFRAYDDLDAESSAGPPGSTSSRSPRARARPDWVVTAQAAIDTELGILKTGKEADVFLRRARRPARPGRRRGDGRQALPRQRAPLLPPGRRLHRGPLDEALPRQPGPQAQEHLGARSGRRRVGGLGVGRAQALLELGVPVPYPVQIDGTEILMEWITVDGETAPRLAQTRPGPRHCCAYLEQLRDALAMLVQARARARRPVGVQHPRRRRAARDHRPAADGRRRRQPDRAWTSCCATARTSAPGSGRAGSRSTSTSCSPTCWRTRSEPGGAARPASRRCEEHRGRVVDIVSLPALDRQPAAGAAPFARWPTRGLDLTERSGVLVAAGRRREFLGCTFAAGDAERAEAGGALVCPTIPDAPVDPYRDRLYRPELYDAPPTPTPSTPAPTPGRRPPTTGTRRWRRRCTTTPWTWP